MPPKYKMTGCFRFILFFVIFLPIVFFGAAYLRGENGVQLLKDYYHKVFPKSEGKTNSHDTYSPTTTSPSSTGCEEVERELKAAQYQIKSLEEELKVKEEVIKELKKK
ncbi:MAG TPA: hypothetical protein VJ508_10185 [Saprospiraceae bacterium]|nr:hypothetical protein [Saprospiraceae bacterium]